MRTIGLVRCSQVWAHLQAACTAGAAQFNAQELANVTWAVGQLAGEQLGTIDSSWQQRLAACMGLAVPRAEVNNNVSLQLRPLRLMQLTL